MRDFMLAYVQHKIVKIKIIKTTITTIGNQLTSGEYLSCAKTFSLPLKHMSYSKFVVFPEHLRRQAPGRKLQGVS